MLKNNMIPFKEYQNEEQLDILQKILNEDHSLKYQEQILFHDRWIQRSQYKIYHLYAFFQTYLMIHQNSQIKKFFEPKFPNYINYLIDNISNNPSSKCLLQLLNKIKPSTKKHSQSKKSQSVLKQSMNKLARKGLGKGIDNDWMGQQIEKCIKVLKGQQIHQKYNLQFLSYYIANIKNIRILEKLKCIFILPQQISKFKLHIPFSQYLKIIRNCKKNILKLITKITLQGLSCCILWKTIYQILFLAIDQINQILYNEIVHSLNIINLSLKYGMCKSLIKQLNNCKLSPVFVVQKVISYLINSKIELPKQISSKQMLNYLKTTLQFLSNIACQDENLEKLLKKIISTETNYFTQFDYQISLAIINLIQAHIQVFNIFQYQKWIYTWYIQEKRQNIKIKLQQSFKIPNIFNTTYINQQKGLDNCRILQCTHLGNIFNYSFKNETKQEKDNHHQQEYMDQQILPKKKRKLSENENNGENQYQGWVQNQLLIPQI